MKLSNVIQEFLLNGLCVSTSLKEAIQMIAVLELFFSLGFIGHGSYLCATGQNLDETIYGALYLFCGITYGALTWLLWTTSKNPTLTRCHTWLAGSVITLFTIAALTVTRNMVESKLIWPIIIWVLCGIFLQIYMIAVVWAFMLSYQHEQYSVVKHASQQKNGKLKATFSPVSGDDNEKKSTVVVAM